MSADVTTQKEPPVESAVGKIIADGDIDEVVADQMWYPEYDEVTP